MDLSSMVTAVLSVAGRLDKQVQAINAINHAVSMVCFAGYSSHDLVETTVAIDGTLYENSFVTSSELTRFRAMHYMKLQGTNRYLHPILADKAFKDDCARNDVYYIAGTTVNLKSSTLGSTLKIGYYQYPPTLSLTGTTTYWPMDLMPTVVHDLALGRLYAGMGNKEEAARYTELGMVGMRELLGSIEQVAR